MANYTVHNPIGYDDQGNIQYHDYTVSGKDNAASARSTAATNEANLMLAKQQNDWNVQQWNRENEYNSPSNQIKLLQEAGLNPNLYTPEGMTSSQLTSANMGTQVAPNLNTQRGSQLAGNIMSALQQGVNIGDSILGKLQYDLAKKKTVAEIKNLDAKTGETKANTDFIIGKTGLQELEAKNLERDLDLKTATIDDIHEKWKNYSQERKESQARIDNMAKKMMLENKRFQNECKELQAKLDLTYNQIEQIQTSIFLTSRDCCLRGEQITYQRLINDMTENNVDVVKIENELKKDHATAMFWKDFILDGVNTGLGALNIVGNLFQTNKRNNAYQQQVTSGNISHANPIQ